MDVSAVRETNAFSSRNHRKEFQWALGEIGLIKSSTKKYGYDEFRLLGNLQGLLIP